MSKVKYLGIEIDYSRDKLIPEQGIAMLTGEGFYKREGENSPQESFARAAVCYCFGDYEFAQRIYDFVSMQDFMYASPVLSNAVEVAWPSFGEHQFKEAGDWLEANVKPEGMPISCFLSVVEDSKEGLTVTDAEAKELSMAGGGVGILMANRAPDEKSTGIMQHSSVYDAMVGAYRQRATRRGSAAVYADINHPEIRPFIHMRDPTSGGVDGKKCFDLNNAVNITDKFMYDAILGNKYQLVDPKHGNTGRWEDTRGMWYDIMQVRKDTGEPYILFTDTANRMIPKRITNPRYRVRQSNLCSEITLYTSFKRTAVCCLSSKNLARYDQWKDTTLTADLVRLLDNVLEYFIRLAPKALSRAVYSAKKERAIGIGFMGWHSFLMDRSIPYESGGLNSAIQWANIIHKDCYEKADAESARLGALRGVPDDLEGSGYRNSHWFAVAPNASSSSILNVSPSGEPWAALAFNAQGRAGSFLIKNKPFQECLKRHGMDTDEVWQQVIADNGGCQGLDFLTDHEKNVFKTLRDISPMWIIETAAAKQPFICQSQSVNIRVPHDITMPEMTAIHVRAWASGLKSLYYCRGETATKVKIGNGRDAPLNARAVRREISFDDSECLSCHG